MLVYEKAVVSVLSSHAVVSMLRAVGSWMGSSKGQSLRARAASLGDFPTANLPGLWKPLQHWSFYHFLGRICSSTGLQWRIGPDRA